MDSKCDRCGAKLGDDEDILTEREARLYREAYDLIKEVERLEAENEELRSKLWRWDDDTKRL